MRFAPSCSLADVKPVHRFAREVGATWEEILGSIMLTTPGAGLLPAVQAIPHARNGYEAAREAESD